jgi:hypothetical protein
MREEAVRGWGAYAASGRTSLALALTMRAEGRSVKAIAIALRCPRGYGPAPVTSV